MYSSCTNASALTKKKKCNMYRPSSLQYKLIYLQSKVFSFFGVLPFVWDEKLLKYKFDYKVCKYAIRTTIPLCTFHYVFLIQETFRHVFVSSYKQLVGRLMFCLVWTIFIVYQQMILYLTFCKSDEFISLLNSFKLYTR